MKAQELVSKALDVAKNYKTLYVLGCFGAPLNPKNKIRYTNNQPYNGKPVDIVVGYDGNGKAIIEKRISAEGKIRKAMIEKASEDTFGFDCVCLVKALLSGWCGDLSRTYGGTHYPFSCPDVGANTMMSRYCKGGSSDFSTIVEGELVWMDGHVGIYVGSGDVVECSPKFENCVQITHLGNVGKKSGNYRMWTKHGKLPWVEYDSKTEEYVPDPTETDDIGKRTYIVKKGDTLSRIASRYNTTVERIVKDNLKTHKSITPDHIVSGWKLLV